MKILIKNGIDKLLFGMKSQDVIDIYGNPDTVFKDDDGNQIHLYDKYKWRLTFYHDEDFRLGYIISSHGDLELFDRKPIGSKIDIVKEYLHANGIKKWEQENFDSTVNNFNEENWLILQTEFGEVIKIEIGATINDDEFNWKFQSK